MNKLNVEMTWECPGTRHCKSKVKKGLGFDSMHQSSMPTNSETIEWGWGRPWSMGELKIENSH